MSEVLWTFKEKQSVQPKTCCVAGAPQRSAFISSRCLLGSECLLYASHRVCIAGEGGMEWRGQELMANLDELRLILSHQAPLLAQEAGIQVTVSY